MGRTVVRYRVLVGLSASLAVVGCSSSLVDPTSEVRAWYERWGDARPGAYRFELTRECACDAELMRPTAIYVVGARVVDASDAQTRSPVDPAGPRARTIDDLFELLLEHVAHRDASITLDFDPDLGYPRLIHGWRADVVNTTFTYRIEAFEANPDEPS